MLIRYHRETRATLTYRAVRPYRALSWGTPTQPRTDASRGDEPHDDEPKSTTHDVPRSIEVIVTDIDSRPAAAPRAGDRMETPRGPRRIRPACGAGAAAGTPA
jgi:hypothetical protein